MAMTLEVAVWLLSVIILFCVFNIYLFLRTASSLFLSILIASALTWLFFNNLFGEIVISFAIVIGLLYAISRAIRDKRDDLKKEEMKYELKDEPPEIKYELKDEPPEIKV